LVLVSYTHATDEKVVPILNKEDINYLFCKIAGRFLSLVQDLIWELARARASLAATHVA